MNVAGVIERIEGHDLSAMVNLASDFRTFVRILGSQPEVLALAGAMSSEQTTREVFTRAIELAEALTDDTYEHPADAALAAYLWLLSTRDQKLCETVAETVLACKQCWWARKVAERVRDAARFHSGAGSRSRGAEKGEAEEGDIQTEKGDIQDLPAKT
jgi:hypothetical protein